MAAIGPGATAHLFNIGAGGQHMFCVHDEAALAAALPGRPPVAVALGIFDGVHLGHRALLAACRQAAARIGGLPLACTFFPHPARILRPAQAPPMLEPLRARVARFAAAGIAGALIKNFSRELAALSPQAFATTLLVEALHAKAVVVGDNFRFGHGRAGDVDLLRSFGGAQGFEVLALPAVERAGEAVSSSRIRAAVQAGDLAMAAALLGRPYALIGEVVHGEARGRELGYPTANIANEGDVLPPLGIYAGWAHTPAGAFQAAVSIGVHPTFAAAAAPKVEAYLLDYAGPPLYGATLEVALLSRLRGEERFASVALLLEQMAIDVAQTRTTLSHLGAPPAFLSLPPKPSNPIAAEPEPGRGAAEGPGFGPTCQS